MERNEEKKSLFLGYSLSAAAYMLEEESAERTKSWQY